MQFVTGAGVISQLPATKRKRNPSLSLKTDRVVATVPVAARKTSAENNTNNVRKGTMRPFRILLLTDEPDAGEFYQVYPFGQPEGYH